jgi:uncharacterized protein (TIGR00730 family)
MEKRQFTICVFCGSSPGMKPEYAAAAKRLGELIAADGYAMVFGAGNLGLMGETARAARDGGSLVTGVLPAFLRHIEPPMPGGEELIVTPDMHQRKDRMETMSSFCRAVSARRTNSLKCLRPRSLAFTRSRSFSSTLQTTLRRFSP